jgi:hypothetical protein
MNVPVPGGGYEPRQFSTWAPQLLSGIGTLPETVRDRAIEIEMLRKSLTLRAGIGPDGHDGQQSSYRASM